MLTFHNIPETKFIKKDNQDEVIAYTTCKQLRTWYPEDSKIEHTSGANEHKANSNTTGFVLRNVEHDFLRFGKFSMNVL